MPLRDHFHSQWSERYHWESFYSNWATRITDGVMAKLPPDYLAQERAEYPGRYEVAVSTRSTARLVGVIQLISPGNKDRRESRRAFASKCVIHLQQAVSVVIIDVVTSRQTNLHNEIFDLLQMDTNHRIAADLYAVAYRPVQRDNRNEIDVWPHTVSVGASLPTLPLHLTGDLFVPVDFETAYQEACWRRGMR